MARNLKVRRLTVVLFMAPAVCAAPKQAAPAETVPQASNDSARSTAGKATSHARPARKHRDGNHHRRPRTTAKKHNL
jgi:hypothetical protein